MNKFLETNKYSTKTTLFTFASSREPSLIEIPSK